MTANRAYLSLFDGDNAIGIGMPYSAIMRHAAHEGLVDLKGEDPEVWVRAMVWAC